MSTTIDGRIVIVMTFVLVFCFVSFDLVRDCALAVLYTVVGAQFSKTLLTS